MKAKVAKDENGKYCIEVYNGNIVQKVIPCDNWKDGLKKLLEEFKKSNG